MLRVGGPAPAWLLPLASGYPACEGHRPGTVRSSHRPDARRGEAAIARRAARWTLSLFLLPLLCGGAWLLFVRPLGPGLIEITDPASDATVPHAALEVVVRFPHHDRTRSETFQVLLNGADVTQSFVAAENGAYGRLFLLVDGENVLRVAVFGRAWWGGERLVEHVEELHFTVRRPVDRHWG